MEIKIIKVGPLLTNCFLLSSKDELALIDPGGDAKKILQEIKETSKSLKYIILTHSHLDHILAAQEIKKETRAKLLIHEIEKYSLTFQPDVLLKEGDEIEIGDIILKVLHTPGHTPGSICLLSKDMAFTGDTLFKEGVGRTDLPGGSSKYLQESLQKLSKVLKLGTKIYPGHGETFEYSPSP
jgi:glyoxylase-like metal-dependent hydrolase (beta-lactamase superfamily II)